MLHLSTTLLVWMELLFMLPALIAAHILHLSLLLKMQLLNLRNPSSKSHHSSPSGKRLSSTMASNIYNSFYLKHTLKLLLLLFPAVVTV